MAMTVVDLLGEVAEHLHDQNMERLDADRLITFLNSAARDAANEGWYVHLEEDESIALVADTYDYNVPATFVYIDQLWLESATTDGLFDRFLPYHYWYIVLDDTVPQIRFDSQFMIIEAGKNIKVVGQKHPSTYTVGSGSIDQNMESFLRERTIAYAARFLARAGEDFDGAYDKLASEAFAISERLLHSHPQAMRQRPNAQYVPGR